MARPTDREIAVRDCGLDLVAFVNEKAAALEKLLIDADEIPDQDRQDVRNMLNQAQACFQWANNKALNLISHATAS